MRLVDASKVVVKLDACVVPQGGSRLRLASLQGTWSRSGEGFQRLNRNHPAEDPPIKDLPAEDLSAMADNEQPQPGVGQQQQAGAQQQPGIKQPDGVQLPP